MKVNISQQQTLKQTDDLTLAISLNQIECLSSLYPANRHKSLPKTVKGKEKNSQKPIFFK